ncbi:hypothetical protein ACLB2K_057832 [Fragaria x ananassa]
MELMNVVWNILCKLPVKSLKRFQSASKSWHDFIHDPEFISQHLHVFNSSRKYQNILDGGSDDQHLHPDGVCAIRPTPTSRFHNIVAYIDLLNLDETSGEVSSRRLLNLPQYDKVQAPFPIMFGPCNGIYCLHHASYLVDDTFHVTSNIYSTYVDGICYWWIYSDNLTSVQVADPGDYWILLYFNLVDQVLGQIMLPPEMVVFRSPNPVASDTILSSTDGSLSVYGGSLCLFITNYCETYQDGPYFDIWVMHDHNNDDSWTKQFTAYQRSFQSTGVLVE